MKYRAVKVQASFYTYCLVQCELSQFRLNDWPFRLQNTQYECLLLWPGVQPEIRCPLRLQLLNSSTKW